MQSAILREGWFAQFSNNAQKAESAKIGDASDKCPSRPEKPFFSYIVMYDFSKHTAFWDYVNTWCVLCIINFDFCPFLCQTRMIFFESPVSKCSAEMEYGYVSQPKTEPSASTFISLSFQRGSIITIHHARHKYMSQFISTQENIVFTRATIAKIPQNGRRW